MGGLDESHRDRTGFLIMPRRLYTWKVHKHRCYVRPRFHAKQFVRALPCLPPPPCHQPPWPQQCHAQPQASKNANAFASVLLSSLLRVRLPRRPRLALRKSDHPTAANWYRSGGKNPRTPFPFHAPSAPCSPIPPQFARTVCALQAPSGAPSAAQTIPTFVCVTLTATCGVHGCLEGSGSRALHIAAGDSWLFLVPVTLALRAGSSAFSRDLTQRLVARLDLVVPWHSRSSGCHAWSLVPL